MAEKTKGKSTWLMSYADLFTLLLTAFLLSVVLINEMENSLFMTIDTLLSQGLKFLDGEPAETYTDINGNGKFDEEIEQFIDCDQKYELCFGDPGWNEEMGNGKYDPYYLDGNKIMIGDGYTDYEVFKHGAVNTFIYYGENIFRENVANLSKYKAESFKDVLKILETL